jgi:hypothetical protein
METIPETKQAAGSRRSPASCCASFEVWPDGKPEWARTINARSAGKAKGEYHRDLTESWPDVPFTKIRARKIGKPMTSERFRANAKYRGMPDVECGQRVTVNGNAGTITGHNSSANFEVLFDDDAPHYDGLKLNVHPQDVVLIRHNMLLSDS